MGLSLPGTALLLAQTAARHAGAGSTAGALRHVYSESRSGGQLGTWPALSSADEPRALPGADSALLAGTGHAHAVPGPGVRCLQPISLFCGSQSGPCQAYSSRPSRLSLPIQEPGVTGGPGLP